MGALKSVYDIKLIILRISITKVNRFCCLLAFFFISFYISPVKGTPFVVDEYRPGNFVHFGTDEPRSKLNLGDNANIGFIVGDSCVVVIDAGGSYEVGRRLRKSIRQVTAKPICYVIITHAHPDHFFGAGAFKQDEPKFVGHAGLSGQLRSRERFYKKQLFNDLGALAKGSQSVQPDMVVEAGTSLTLSIGKNHDVEVRAWRPAHTDHDLSVLDLKQKVLWTGDLVFTDHIPILDSNITSFISVSEELRQLDQNFFVPGHGRPSQLWKKALDMQIDYLNVLMRETREEIKKGSRLMQAVHSVGWSEKHNWLNFEFFHRRNVTTAWTELEWE